MSTASKNTGAAVATAMATVSTRIAVAEPRAESMLKLRRHGVVLVISGEPSSRPGGWLQEQLRACRGAVRPGGVAIVDLTRAAGLDSDIVRTLVAAQRECRNERKTLTLAPVTTEVRKAMALVDSATELPVYDTVDEAIERSKARFDAHRRGASVSALPSPTSVTEHRTTREYENLEPLFLELIRCPADSAEHRRLRRSIVEKGMPLADNIARRFAHRGEPFDDLAQVARLGLLRAVDRFDPTVGSEFLSFAVPTIMGEVKRHFRDHTWAMRVPRSVQEMYLRTRTATETLVHDLGRQPRPSELAAHMGVDVDEVVQAMLTGNAYQTSSYEQVLTRSDSDETSLEERIGDIDTGYAHVDEYLTIAPLLAQLPDRERSVLVMRFFESMTQSQIAERIGVSQMQVCRILARTLDDLREKSRL